MPVTFVSCERSFSKRKLIKDFRRSTITQERLTDLGILSIEFEIAEKINFNKVIDTEMASVKARKVKF